MSMRTKPLPRLRFNEALAVAGLRIGVRVALLTHCAHRLQWLVHMALFSEAEELCMTTDQLAEALGVEKPATVRGWRKRAADPPEQPPSGPVLRVLNELASGPRTLEQIKQALGRGSASPVPVATVLELLGAMGVVQPGEQPQTYTYCAGLSVDELMARVDELEQRYMLGLSIAFALRLGPATLDDLMKMPGVRQFTSRAVNASLDGLRRSGLVHRRRVGRASSARYELSDGVKNLRSKDPITRFEVGHINLLDHTRAYLTNALRQGAEHGRIQGNIMTELLPADIEILKVKVRALIDDDATQMVKRATDAGGGVPVVSFWALEALDS